MVDHRNSSVVSYCEARSNPSRFRPARLMRLRSGFHGVQVQIFPPHNLIWLPAKGNRIRLAGTREAGWLVLTDTGRHETREPPSTHLHPPLPRNLYCHKSFILQDLELMDSRTSLVDGILEAMCYFFFLDRSFADSELKTCECRSWKQTLPPRAFFFPSK